MTTATLITAFLVASAAQAGEPSSATSATPAAVETTACPTPEAPAEASPPVQRIGRLGVGGAVVAPAGLGAFVGGAVVFARGTEVENPAAAVLEITDYRPQGRVLLGVGAGAFALGMTAVIVDVAIRSKKRRGLVAGPTFAPDMAGVTFSSRF